MPDDTSRLGGKADQYRVVKLGDAVETPDGELWVVLRVGFGEAPPLSLVSSYRDSDGRIYADTYDEAETSVPRDLVTKVADARRVRR